jgi:SAM-dependent methyltransferase
MVLHYLPALDGPLAEMHRVLRPGGAAVVVELAPHGEAWMRGALGDRHLGLAPGDVIAAFERAGFTDVALDPLEDHYRPESPAGAAVELDLFAVRGRTPRAHAGEASGDRS